MGDLRSAAAGELNLDWDFKSAFGYDTNPLQEELSDTFLAPAVDLRYSILDGDSFTLRLSLGYSYAEADWQTGEHDAGEIGEEPNEFYAIAIASASLSLQRIAAYVDFAWISQCVCHACPSAPAHLFVRRSHKRAIFQFILPPRKRKSPGMRRRAIESLRFP
jgi:hypothetical protein